jgi:small-conductance mechanosensitive channel
MDFRRITNHLAYLDATFRGVSVGTLLLFIAISIACFVVLTWLRRTLAQRLGKIAARTATTLDDLVVGLIRRTNRLFLLFVSVYLGMQVLAMRPRVASVVDGALLIVVLWQMGVWAHEVIDYSIRALVNEHAGEDAGLRTATGTLRFLARVAVWSLLALVALANFQVNITTLVAGLGVGGIAIALAIQNILGDLFASLSILLDRPFAVGHFIVVDGLAGTVDHVGLKTTRIRSLSGEEIVISNTDLLKSRIHNYKRLYERRVLFGFGVTYDTGYERLAAIPSMVREIIEAVSKTRFDRAHFKEYGDSSLNFEVVYYVLDPGYNMYMDIQQAINLRLYQRFEEDGIEFAFPTRTLLISRGDVKRALADGDRESGDRPADYKMAATETRAAPPPKSRGR